jgi:hypothetical protein
VFFLIPWVVTVVGFVVHALVDRKANRRTPFRLVELALVWLLVFGGGWALFGAFAHLGPNSTEVARGIGYAPSMFQWEVGWGDIVIGVLGVGCAWRRDSWMTAAVVALTLGYGGDAIGHVMSWLGPDRNVAPDNVWAIPSDVLGPLLAIVLLIAYRRLSRNRAAAPEEPELTPVGH